MSLECFLSHSLVSSNIKLAFKSTNTYLLEKSWYTASNLHIANHKLAITDYLFSLCEICHIPFVIDPSCKVAGTLFFIWPSWNYCVR